MTAATTATLAFSATFGYLDQRASRAPACSHRAQVLALVAGAALWIGLGSIVVLLAAWAHGTRRRGRRSTSMPREPRVRAASRDELDRAGP